jgi:phenylpropionate dioxygenase-like ring-hydroxylating dioxygenase large terminal subunit
MKASHFWYVVAESKELKAGKSLARVVLGEWLAIFRDEQGKAVALLDRCLHRGSQISGGPVLKGCLRCPYHGWTYDCSGKVVQVPSEGPEASRINRRPQKVFRTLEQDGFVYVCLEDSGDPTILPFKMPRYGERGWHTIRLQNHFRNTVTNCAENFVDVPHTVFVHPAIFRTHKYQKFGATVTRENGSVIVRYRHETSNFGIFSWFLNPSGQEIQHTDSFHMPNVTCVEYIFSPNRIFYITSQSVPVGESETLVYTDLTYNYGIWTRLAAPLIRRQGQLIIDQDIRILGNQMDTIKKYGDQFMNSEADAIHIQIESIRNEIENGRDPRVLAKRVQEIEFWV